MEVFSESTAHGLLNLYFALGGLAVCGAPLPPPSKASGDGFPLHCKQPFIVFALLFPLIRVHELVPGLDPEWGHELEEGKTLRMALTHQ